MTEESASPARQACATKLVQVKIVYWGPAEAGKTTSLLAVAYIFSRFKLDDVIVVQTTAGRTLWNEYAAFQFTIPAGAASVDVVVHLSALTGQERFLATREFAGASIDGAIFVADCRPDFMQATARSFEELMAFAPPGTPVVVQANFQDIPSSIRPTKLEAMLASRWKGRFIKTIPTIANSGLNVSAAFLDLLYAILCTHK
jgi:mutual gliding-motility protein MglA